MNDRLELRKGHRSSRIREENAGWTFAVSKRLLRQDPPIAVITNTTAKYCKGSRTEILDREARLVPDQGCVGRSGNNAETDPLLFY